MSGLLMRLWMRLRVLSFRGYRATLCGHTTKQQGIVTAFGKESALVMPINEQGSVDYCLSCIGKMAIQCAWCKEPIFIGDPVTLYIYPEDKLIPEHAVVHDANRRTVVGCLRWNCAETGADRTGFWLPDSKNHGKGCVLRVPSPLEEAMATGEAVSVGDLGSISDALQRRSSSVSSK